MEIVRPSAVANTATADNFSHVSIEVGHFEPRDFGRGVEHFANLLGRVAPWLGVARTAWVGLEPEARASTCFLVDDYTAPIRPPSEVIPKLQKAVKRSSIGIDYLVRESAFVDGDGLSLARLVESQIAQAHSPAAGDLRPPAAASAWLSDGERRLSLLTANRPVTDDSVRAASPHSIFVDIKLWTENSSDREWSCSFLATVWQLARLGLLDDTSRAYMAPQIWDKAVPSQWDDLPSVIQLNQDAAPFCAYRTVSILGSRYIPVEAAVQAILKSLPIEPEILKRMSAHSKSEGVLVPERLLDRINYVFVGR